MSKSKYVIKKIAIFFMIVFAFCFSVALGYSGDTVDVYINAGKGLKPNVYKQGDRIIIVTTTNDIIVHDVNLKKNSKKDFDLTKPRTKELVRDNN